MTMILSVFSHVIGISRYFIRVRSHALRVSGKLLSVCDHAMSLFCFVESVSQLEHGGEDDEIESR